MEANSGQETESIKNLPRKGEKKGESRPDSRNLREKADFGGGQKIEEGESQSTMPFFLITNKPKDPRESHRTGEAEKQALLMRRDPESFWVQTFIGSNKKNNTKQAKRRKVAGGG